MKKIADTDIVKEAIDELESSPTPMPQAVSNQSPIDNYLSSKNSGHSIGFAPASILGALAGGIIANKQVNKNYARALVKNGPTLDGNYYTETQNIANNLKVIFTPLSVIYTVKNGLKETTIDTIETSEMNKDMYDAWQKRDAEYYKNLILIKMYSEMQVVENSFAKRYIARQMALKNQVQKKASDGYVADDTNYEDMTDIEVLGHVADLKDMYSRNKEVFSKVAAIILSQMDDEYEISMELDRPFDKYAYDSDPHPLSFLGLSPESKDLRALQGKFMDPSYLNGRLKIAFLPDRVIFTVDARMIGTLLSMNMNDDGYEHFQKQDKLYFKNYFKEEIKRGLSRMSQKPVADTEKKAASSDISQIFTRNDIHPIIYYVALTKKYGFDWFGFEPFALLKAIETDFGVDEVESVPLNIILSIQVANISETPYSSYHAFEKVIRSFNSKPVDFLKRQSDDLDISDIAFGIDMIERVTPHDDVYDNFSEEIFNYLMQMFADNEIYLYKPSVVTGAPNESQFNSVLNLLLLGAINGNMLSKMDKDPALEKEILKNNTTICEISSAVLDALRKQFQKGNVSMEQTRKFSMLTLEKLQVKKELREIIIKQIVKNVALDQFLLHKESILGDQLQFFSLKMDRSEE